MIYHNSAARLHFTCRYPPKLIANGFSSILQLPANRWRHFGSMQNHLAIYVASLMLSYREADGGNPEGLK